MTKASESVLADLHNTLARTMASSLNNQEEAMSLLEQFREELPVAVQVFLKRAATPNPAMLAAVAKFLKDNNITADPDQSGTEVSQLGMLLASKRQKSLNDLSVEDTIN